MDQEITATKIVFIESDEVSFQFRQCMAGVMQSLPEIELFLAKNADEALELIENNSADVLVVDDELTDDLQVIIDNQNLVNIPIILQSDEEELSLQTFPESTITILPKEESIEEIHQTLRVAHDLSQSGIELRETIH